MLSSKVCSSDLMIIKKIEFYPLALERKKRFVIATGSSKIAHNIAVKVVTDDLIGWGNACPSRVTDEDSESVQKALKLFSKRLIGEDATRINKIHSKMDALLSKNPSAKAGIDIALYDLLAKRAHLPLYKLLGGHKKKMLTDMTIGIDDAEVMVKRAIQYKKEGFKALKIKIGLDVEEDIEKLREIRKAVGDDIKIWVDVNQGYDENKTIDFIKRIRHLNIEFIEQPVKSDDLTSLGNITKKSPIPIMVDESVKSPEDCLKIVRNRYANLLNIKLMKCGGINPAIKINNIAERGGLKVMLGCMGESLISIAAALHFALSQKNVIYGDLDSHFTLKKDVAKGITFKNGYLSTSDKDGLGIEVDI